MIFYMVGKLAPNSPHSTSRLVKYVSGEAIFVPSPPKTGTNLRQPRPPQSLNDSEAVAFTFARQDQDAVKLLVVNTLTL